MHLQQLRVLRAVIIVALLGATRLTAIADVHMTQQGRLTDASDVPLPDGTYEVKFCLTSSCGTVPVWEETHMVPLKDGLFSVTLGTITPLDESKLHDGNGGGVYLDDIERHLTVKLTGYPDLPCVRLTGVPYAAVATRMTGDVTTQPGEIKVSKPSATGYSHLSTAALMLFSDLAGLVPGATLQVDPVTGAAFYVDKTPELPAHACEISTNRFSLDFDEDGNPNCVQDLNGVWWDPNDDGVKDIEVLSNALNVANPVVTTLSGPTNVNNSFDVDADNDGTRELEISAVGETIGRNGLYWYIGSNITPRFSIDNAGTIYMDPNGSATTAGMSYNASTLAFNLRRSPLTMDLNGNGVADVNFSTSGLCTFDCNLDGTPDYSFGGTACNINKPCGFSSDGDATSEVQITAGGEVLIDPDEDAVNELVVGDNSVTCKAAFTVDEANDGVNEFSITAGAVWLNGNVSINPDGVGSPSVAITSSGIVCASPFSIDINDDATLDITATLDALVPTMEINGDLNVTGTKNFVQEHPLDPTREIVYVALESGEAGTYVRGSSRLKDGAMAVELPEHFALVTNAEGLTVQITPRGPVQSMIYVESVTTAQLIVKASDPSDACVSFDYMINGVRAGFEDHEVVRQKREYSVAPR